MVARYALKSADPEILIGIGEYLHERESESPDIVVTGLSYFDRNPEYARMIDERNSKNAQHYAKLLAMKDSSERNMWRNWEGPLSRAKRENDNYLRRLEKEISMDKLEVASLREKKEIGYNLIGDGPVYKVGICQKVSFE